MFWADKIAADVQGPQVVNDSKTPSGRVHVGSVRGVIVHDTIYRALKQASKPVKFLYGTDDYDALDTVPSYLDRDRFERYLGWPLCNVPSPDEDAPGDRGGDYAKYYMGEFLDVFDYLGVRPEIYYLRDYYRSGQLNPYIDLFLKNAHLVREAYYQVSKAQRPDNWYPFQAICENCGKIATTQVTDYQDGKIFYTCDPNATDYTQGCGHSGWMSPFDGNGKLPWKVEWVAKWQLLGVTIELAGKDHSQKGGSRDVANAICRKVLGKNAPFHSPYEFILVDGTKMSSSKGIGSSARAMADLLPPELLRFLMLRTPPRTAINFSPNYETIARLFRDYDGLIERYRQGTADGTVTNDALPEDFLPLLYAQPDGEIVPYQPFELSTLISLLQVPHLDLAAEVEQRAVEALSERDRAIVEERLAVGRHWLENYADEDEKLVLYLEEAPAAAATLSADQITYVESLLERLGTLESWDGETLQSALFATAKALDLKMPVAFQSIYRAFLNRDRGPKAGPLLSYLDKQLVCDRLAEAIALSRAAV
ncbi:MAG: lysine--tRNA ligase [Cyanophyceae cyanobacterium]